MAQYKYIIGIDISKEKLDIAVLQGKIIIAEECIENSTKALAAWGKTLKKRGIVPDNVLLACEHTGIYTTPLIGWSAQNEYKIWVEKAIQIKKSIGLQRGKNDQVDAYRIATYAFRYQDQALFFERPRKEIEELKYLLSLRERLIKTKKQLSVPLKEMQNRIDKKIYKNITHCSDETIKALEKNLKQVKKEIEKIIKGDKNILEKVEIVTSVSGVGLITAVSLIVATNEFKAVKSGKQLACYVGVAPFPHQSGTSIRGKNRISHFANKPLKSLLHLCAISAKRTLKNSLLIMNVNSRKVRRIGVLLMPLEIKSYCALWLVYKEEKNIT